MLATPKNLPARRPRNAERPSAAWHPSQHAQRAVFPLLEGRAPLRSLLRGRWLCRLHRTYPLLGTPAISFRNINMHVMPSGASRHRRYRPDTSKWIEHHVPSIAIKLDQPVDQPLRERCRVRIFHRVRPLREGLAQFRAVTPPAPHRVSAPQERQPTARLWRNRPKAIAKFNKLLGGNVGSRLVTR